MDIAQFHRVGDLTTTLFGFAIVYFYSTDGDTLPIYAILRWLPVLSAPLLFGQIYSMGQLLPLSALFYSMRRYGIPAKVDIRLPYALICILAAGSGNALILAITLVPRHSPSGCCGLTGLNAKQGWFGYCASRLRHC
jgi:hypothetical protein